MKIYLLLFITLLLVCISCKSIKVREIPILDATQPFSGKIEKIHITQYTYPLEGALQDTLKETGTILFDKNNKIIEHSEQDEYNNTELILDPKNKYFKSVITKNKNSNIFRSDFTYDKNGNILKFSSYKNDKLVHSNESKYDSKGNIIEKSSSDYAGSGKVRNRLDKWSYNYKLNYYIVQSNDDTNKGNQLYVKRNFDKNGFITKEEIVNNKEEVVGVRISYDYDEKGNLMKRCLLGKDGTPYDITVYKNILDEKGNIVVREKYWNNKLVEKKYNKIIYR